MCPCTGRHMRSMCPAPFGMQQVHITAQRYISHWHLCYVCSQDARQKLQEQHASCRIGTDDRTGSMRRLHSRRCTERLGVSIPALAVSRDGSGEPEPVLIYFGIIDFLQEYRMKKRMEHMMKATVFGGKTISVVDPHRYAKRFRGFMEDVFVRK